MNSRYDGYTRILHKALHVTRALPRISAPNAELMRLRKEHRIAHWQYKVLTKRGFKAEVERERRDNTAKEYRRVYRRQNKKARDARQIEQMIADTKD